MSLRDKFKIIDAGAFPEWVEDETLGVLEWHARLFQLNTEGKLAGNSRMNHSAQYIEQVESNYHSFYQCFKSCELQYCWEKVRALDSVDGYKGQVWLAYTLWNSFPHPKSKLMTKGEAEEWKLKLQKSLTTVKDLINEMPQNIHSWDYIDSIREALKESNYVKERREIIDDFIMPNPIQLIDSYLNSLESAEYSPIFSGKHVKSKTADRVYFMRSLTSSFKNKMSQPHRRIVCAMVCQAFECEISREDVVRTTRGIDKIKRNDLGVEGAIQHFSKYMSQMLD